MRRLICILSLAFLVSALTAFGQSDSESSAKPLKVENAADYINNQPGSNAVHRGERVTIKEFRSDNIKEVTGNIDYTEKPPKKKEHETEDEEPESGTAAPASATPWGGEAIRWISYILILGAVLYFLFVIIRNTTSAPSNPKLTIRDDYRIHPVENIEELEIDRLLREARESADYRFMIRIQYLALLKALNSKGFIKWERDKTNREYTMELFSREVPYHEFRKLTLAYETVWYGEHVIDAAGCHVIMSGFDSIQEHLSNRPK